MGYGILFAVLIAVGIYTARGLQCYNCTDISDPALCQSTATCSAGQFCFEESRQTASGRRYSMSCRDVQVCTAMQTHVLIGRSVGKRQLGMCQQCCSVDNCNTNLCSSSSHIGPESFLLVMDGNQLYQMDVASHMVHEMTLQTSDPRGFDYDYITKKVVWWDDDYERILRQTINSTQNEHEKFTRGNEMSEDNGLAVDPISRLVFFARQSPDEIMAVSLETGQSVAVLNTSYYTRIDIALDLEQRQIYWADSTQGTIEVANYNGTSRRTLVTGLQRPVAITLDETRNILYWAESGNHKIERANKDGTNRRTVAVIKGTDFVGLAVLGSDIFYTSTNVPSVMKITTSGGTPHPFGKSDFSNLHDIKVFKTSLFNGGSNACSTGNGGCSHVCMPTSDSTRECLCHVGYRLSTNATSCIDTTLIRLAGSNATPWQGRVELSLDNGATWNTFCADLGQNYARVLCKMLGFEGQNAAKIADSSIFGSANSSFGTIGTPDCSEYEDRITECRFFTLYPCSHSSDLAINCSNETTTQLMPSTSVTTPGVSTRTTTTVILSTSVSTPGVSTIGKLRLVGDNNNAKDQGRVEILMNNQWGTICDDNFGPAEAAVVCGSLGFSRIGAVVKPSFYFGQASTSTPIHLDDVKCIGYETSLLECKHNKLVDSSDCFHKEDVGVICKAATFTQVRLVGGGSDSNKGTVEISTDNGLTWNTICDNNFSDKEAQVVCYMLGFSRIGASARSHAYFGQGHDSSKTLRFDCYGPETSLLNCNQYAEACSHSQDAGVICPYSNTEQLRLVDGPSLNQGRVEISLDEGKTWRTVCGDTGNNEVKVICGSLGYPRDFSLFKGYANSSGSYTQEPLLHFPECNGTETSLIDCRQTASRCTHDYDLEVMCLAESTTQVRLYNNQLQRGRVEVSFDNGTSWGTICNDYFGSHEAEVICRMLGFNATGSMAITDVSDGSDTNQRILLDDLNCLGDETSIIQCKRNPIGEHDCTHDEDAGVECNLQGFAVIRLTGSNSSRTQGRVEIRIGTNGEWGTICDDYFDGYVAAVICFMLGFQRTHATPQRNPYFGGGLSSQPVILDALVCTGHEQNILQCKQVPFGLTSCNGDAGVICLP